MDEAIKAMRERVEKAKAHLSEEVASALKGLSAEVLGGEGLGLDKPTQRLIDKAVDRHVNQHVEALLKGDSK